MPKTRKTRGGSGLRLPSGVFRGLKAHTQTHTEKNTPRLKKRGPTNHENLTNANLEDLHVVNISGPEWTLAPGNRNRSVPTNLRPYRATLSNIQRMHQLGPGVRVFTSRRRRHRHYN